VLVQREMETVRAPLVSLARARRAELRAPNATATGTRKQEPKVATGFKKRSAWWTAFFTGRTVRLTCTARLTSRLPIEWENQLATKKRTALPAPGCPG
jgi:hypothetical protein